MRKNYILLFAFVSVHSVCLAQQSKTIDSLLRVLQSQKEDTNKVKTLINLSRNYYLEENDSLAMKYASEAIISGLKLNYLSGIFRGYTNIGFVYDRKESYEESLKNFQSAFTVAKQTGNKRDLASAYQNVGYGLANLNRSKEALSYYEVAAKLYEELGDKRQASMNYYNIGITNYTPLCNYVEAIKAHTMSLTLATEIGWKSKMGASHTDIGNCYESLGNYPEALKHYLEALKLCQEAGHRGNVAVAYNNIGEIYSHLGDLDKAMEYYLAGLKIFQEVKSPYGISISYDDIGMIYQKKGNYEEALKNHLAALKISSDGHYTYGIASSYSNIGSVYFLQSNYVEAIKNYFLALKLFYEIEEKEGLAKVNNSVGETYFKMKYFPESRKYFNQALASAKEFGGKQIIANAYEYLASLDSAEAKWDTAYMHHKLFILYRDSLISEENKNTILKNMMQYEFEKKEDSLKYQQSLINEKLKQQTLLASQQKQSLLLEENEVTLLNNEKQLQKLQLKNSEAELTVQKTEAEKKRNQLILVSKENDIQSLQIKKQKQFRNYLLIGLVLLITTASFGYYNYRTRQLLRLQMLRNKIASDLHDDVGSTLSSISIFSQMAQQKSKEVNPLLDIIGESSRKMLDAMADIVWTINPENDQFEKIILRMKSFAYELLGARNIDFEFNADEEVVKMKLSMEVRKNLYLIFKEATNNLVKYSGANKARFDIKAEKDSLTMLISDNGKGFDQQQRTMGNGLKNMKRRAEEIGAQFIIESRPGGGTSLELKISV